MCRWLSGYESAVPHWCVICNTIFTRNKVSGSGRAQARCCSRKCGQILANHTRTQQCEHCRLGKKVCKCGWCSQVFYRTCKWCDQRFVTRFPQALYCKNECQYKGNLRDKRDGHVLSPFRGCKVCGSIVRKDSCRRRRYCSKRCARKGLPHNGNHRRRARHYGADYDPHVTLARLVARTGS